MTAIRTGKAPKALMATRFVTKNVFRKTFSGKRFPENVFRKTFLVTKRVAMRAFGAFPVRIAVIFHADADFEVKSDVGSYFWHVFLTFFGPKCWSKFCVFCVCGPSLLSANAGIMVHQIFVDSSLTNTACVYLTSTSSCRTSSRWLCTCSAKLWKTAMRSTWGPGTKSALKSDMTNSTHRGIDWKH